MKINVYFENYTIKAIMNLWICPYLHLFRSAIEASLRWSLHLSKSCFQAKSIFASTECLTQKFCSLLKFEFEIILWELFVFKKQDLACDLSFIRTPCHCIFVFFLIQDCPRLDLVFEIEVKFFVDL